MKILRNILWFLAVVNIISMICWELYSGSCYTVPLIPMVFCMCAVFGLIPNSAVGIITVSALMIYRKVKNYTFEKNHIILLLINLMGIIIGWHIFQIALLSV